MTAQTYRKRSLTQALQFTGDNVAEIQEFTSADWFRLRSQDQIDLDVEHARSAGRSPEVFIAEVYDYIHDTWVKVASMNFIAKGPKGEFYPINSEVFAETYEPAEG